MLVLLPMWSCVGSSAQAQEDMSDQMCLSFPLPNVSPDCTHPLQMDNRAYFINQLRWKPGW